MEFGPSPMDLVSTVTNQVVKTMHPQGSSASLSQQSHISQSLSNMHTNTNAAHSYSSQHTFSLNRSSGSAGTFMNQEQPPASNHPVASSSVDQSNSYSIQKSTTQTTTVSVSQSLSITPVQPIANVAPQTTEQALPEKSQANGTSESEAPQPSIAQQSGISMITKDKAPVARPASPQPMEIEPPSVQENIIETSSLPIPAKTEPVTSNATPEVLNTKAQEVLTPEEADSPTSSSTVAAQPENEKTIALQLEQDPLYQPEDENSEVPEQVVKQQPKIEATKQEDRKVESDLPKIVEAPSIEPVKSIPLVESPKEERTAQKEIPEVKTPLKTVSRKVKTSSSQEGAQTPVTPASSASTTAASSGVSTVKRQRIRTQHYQSPLPEVEFVSKISSTSLRNNDERLIVFYKNEFLAVRNAEGGFYLCQAVQNIYKSSPKIKIRWLSQDKNDDQKEVYTPDFYDLIDFDCILTNLSLSKADKGKFILPPAEKARTESILNRSLAVEKGEEITSPSLTEEHPDGLDLSLYRDEDQLKKRKGRKRNRRAAPASVPKVTPTEKSPKAPKVRKVVTPAKAPVKKVVATRPVQSLKKSPPPVEAKPVASTAKPSFSKTSGKAVSKAVIKTSPVVDQKKAKVLARIGKKTAVATATKSAKNNSKNGKSENKATVSSNKTVQPKASSNGSVKTTTRSVRKSTRK